MATTLPAESTQHARNSAQRAIAFDHVQRIGGLSRIVDRDIEILKMNLVQLHDGRDGARSSAWERLESAWETVRSELADDSASSPLTGDVSPRNSAAVAAAEVDAPMAVVPTVPLALRPLNWVTGVLGPAVSSRTRQVVRWSREPARRAELRTAALKVWSLVSSAALAGAKHASNGWRGLEGLVRRQAESLESMWSRLEGQWQTWKAARPQSAEIEASAGAIEVDSLAGHAIGLLPRDDAPAADLPNTGSDLVTLAQKYRGNGSTNLAQGDSGEAYSTAWEGSAQARLESAKEAVKSKLALIDGASRPTLVASTMPKLDEPTTSSPDMPFVLKPLPWVLGALSPVISARTMMMHHGSYYAQCIESANRLSRDHKKLAGKNPLEIVRWAQEHARGTELLATASEAWNHSFYWQCLTPAKKRPSGELRKALYGMFGDFSNFADKFALAGATHVGSGWLWLTANSRKHVRILATSDADCPEARGHTCLLAIDLWEHAYYLDHQNRRREYLDALIDRRLDWEFAEQRFRLVLQRETPARRKTSSRAGDRKRSRHPKQQRKAATSRRPLATTPNSMQRMRFPASPYLRACRRGDADATDTTKRGRCTEQTRTGGSSATSGRPRKFGSDAPPGARQEGVAVAQALGVQPLLDTWALSRELLHSASPEIIHLATHGFCLSFAEAEAAHSLAAPLGKALDRRMVLEDPMQRSGLAMSGINAALEGRALPPEVGKGVVFASDIQQIDLQRTDLVVMSACRSGLGDVEMSDGAHGLRRAFFAAGCGSVVSTLWDVPDVSASKVMKRFYELLLQKEPRLDALNKARESVRAEHPRDPVHWAGFVLDGYTGRLVRRKISGLGEEGNQALARATLRAHVSFEAKCLYHKIRPGVSSERCRWKQCESRALSENAYCARHCEQDGIERDLIHVQALVLRRFLDRCLANA